MLYIFVILFIALLSVYGRVSDSRTQLKNFDLQETLPLRGLLAISVMLTHLCPYLTDEAPLLQDFCLWGPPSVASFFLLAGYGLAFSYKKKGEAYLHGFFKKRLVRLLWPLLFMTLVYQGYKIYHNNFDWLDMLITPSPMSWFIYALVIWYVGYYFSFKTGKTLKAQLGLIWGFTLVYLTVTIFLKQSYFYISILPLPMAITYVFYEEKVKAFILRHANAVWWVVMIAILIVMGYAVAGQYGMKLPGWSMPVYTLVPWVIVYITYYLGGWKNRFTNFLGRISYEFYIVHGFIVMLLGGCHLFGMTGYANAVVVIICVFGLTAFAAWILSKLCACLNNVIK